MTTPELFDLADEWESLGELDWAVAEYTRLHRAGLGGADTLIHRAALHREAGRLNEAARDLDEAARLEPHRPWALIRHAEMLDSMGRPLAAAALQAQALEREGADEVRVFAAAGRLTLGWLDAADRIARELPDTAPGWWAGVRSRSLAGWRAKHAEVRALLRARRAAADPHACALDLADGLIRLGRLRPAGRLTAALMRDRPDDFRGFDLHRRLLERREGADAALVFLRGPGEAHRGRPDRERSLGLLLHDMGRYGEALEVLGATASDDDAEPDDVRRARAMGLRMLGRWDELRAYCRDWLRRAPLATAPGGYVTSAALGPAFDRAGPSPPAGGAGAVLAQFWDADEPPEDVAAVMRSWREQHPALAHRVFSAATARDFLLDRFGAEVAETFDLCRHAAMKADLFRIAHLLAEGGAWADADERCLRPMDAILAEAGRAEILAALSGDTPGYIHNQFMGARRGSRVLERALAEAVAEVRRVSLSGVRPDIWQVTGPGLITRATATVLLEGEPPPGPVRLFALKQYRAYAETVGSLAYKRRAEGNWHLQ